MQRGPIEDIRAAMRHPAAACLGLYMGGYVPLLSFLLMHSRDPLVLWQRVLVGACLAYSASSVWVWATMTLGSAWKATFYVVLLEGGMTVSGIPAMEWAALVLLIFVNATHTAAIVSRLSARHTAKSPEHLPELESGPLSDPQRPANFAESDRALPALELVSHAADRKKQRLNTGSSQATAARADVLYRRAVAYVKNSGRCSINSLKPNLNVGWATAQKLVKRMEEEGLLERNARGKFVVSPPDAGSATSVFLHQGGGNESQGWR